MARSLLQQVIPVTKRRSVAELALDLDPADGEVSDKKSAFWTMLTLSAVIASAGVLADSTATVIGAMIVAPLSTPIMGIALGLITHRARAAIIRAISGAGLVIAVGMLFSALLPAAFDVTGNSQITGRTSPGALDLIAALATGLAGAVGLARRDVAAVLPGVAIAISLVPPLAVIGVCLGQGHIPMAVGALLLFLSNAVSMIVAGGLIFAVLDFAESRGRQVRRRAKVVLATLLVGISIPLVLNTALAILLSTWSARVSTQAEAWLAQSPDAVVTEVIGNGTTFTIKVRTPNELPPISQLRSLLANEMPVQIQVVVETTQGQSFDAGVIPT